jgi:hypothetical protein
VVRLLRSVIMDSEAMPALAMLSVSLPMPMPPVGVLGDDEGFLELLVGRPLGVLLFTTPVGGPAEDVAVVLR